ncbi:hypothetical protein BDZ89DRAFT_502139 [Hymenopellis radicata]|nr:hypothetical protein BDZ89DRAFT_502139 [Hymenopellis radicata]
MLSSIQQAASVVTSAVLIIAFPTRNHSKRDGHRDPTFSFSPSKPSHLLFVGKCVPPTWMGE